jgi:hypothetical protein
VKNKNDDLVTICCYPLRPEFMPSPRALEKVDKNKFKTMLEDIEITRAEDVIKHGDNDQKNQKPAED